MLPVYSGRMSEKLVAAARALGLTMEIHRFPQGTKTAADAARAIGCPVGAIVKSLVFVVDGEPVVALVPGDRRVDPELLAEAAGGRRAERAPLDVARAATGFVPGGTPPFGYASPLRVFADPALRRHEIVWAAAGNPFSVFALTVAAVGAELGATWASISRVGR